MMLEAILIGTVLSVTAVAAIIDHRTGHIPNWLTLPMLVAAPVFYGIVSGFHAAMLSLVGAILVGVIPFLVYRSGGLGGGDVKLFMAIGAVLGAGLGFRVELYSFLGGAAFGVILLAKRGQLRQGMRAMIKSLTRPFQRGGAAGQAFDFGTIRFGPLIFLATVVTLSGLV
jgi:prepilin peptidase CpaA